MLHRVKLILQSVRQYKTYALITPIFMIMEAALECMMPFIMSVLIDDIGLINQTSDIATKHFDNFIFPVTIVGILAAMPLMLLSTAVFWLFHVGDAAARWVLWAELFVVLAITLLREGQILRGKYFVLQTFLYLCGLELIPLATLIAVAAVL